MFQYLYDQPYESDFHQPQKDFFWPATLIAHDFTS